MPDFYDCNQLGKMGESIVRLGLEQVYKRVNQTPNEITIQLQNADIVCSGFQKMAIPDMKYEVKTEWAHTGNLFWETWSNKSTGRKGWGLTSTADELYYLFWDKAIGYRIPDLQRKIWVFDYSKSGFPEVQQNKNEQDNDTWGRLVPVNTGWLGAIKFEFQQAKKMVA